MTRTRALGLFFVISLVFAGHDGFAQAGSGGAIVMVTDAKTGQALPKALVQIGKHKAVRAMAGSFAVKRMTAGRTTLTCAHIGYRRQRRTVVIAAGKASTFRCRLQPNRPKLDRDKGKDAEEDSVAPAVAERKPTSTRRPAPRKRYRRHSVATTGALGGYGGIVAPEAAPLDRENYNVINENDFHTPKGKPLSTFSIDVDTASYSNVRRFLNQGRLPNKDAVKIEELINYFSYNDETPKGKHPFAVTTEVSQAPWNPRNKLVRIGIRGKSVATKNMPDSNLVFLLDVSGSMNSPNKLPLLKNAFRLLVNNIGPRDRVAIVVYAGAAGLVLPSTKGSNKAAILAAIDKLEAGGSTAGGAGIQLAYNIATQNFIKGGNNRIILATDGDFNVGTSGEGELVRLIEKKRKTGVFLTVLGFGTGNYQDAKMEKLADKGNGNHAYIDSILEAKKVLVTEMGSTLLTIAKDVKIQVEFNPAHVKEYRLIGYENRKLSARDFNDDKKDAGELGAGHTITAMYEIVPTGSKKSSGSVDALRYQTKTASAAANSDELMTVKLRYKKPAGKKSTLLKTTVFNRAQPLGKASANMRFAAAVAQFGMLLRNSKYKGASNYSDVIRLARAAMGADREGYRAEFLSLVHKAKQLSGSNAKIAKIAVGQGHFVGTSTELV